MHAAQDELARAEREHRGSDRTRADLDGSAGVARGEASGTRTPDKRQPPARDRHQHTDGRLDRDVVITRNVKRRQKVAIEPALIRRKRARNERDADRSDDKLSYETRRASSVQHRTSRGYA